MVIELVLLQSQHDNERLFPFPSGVYTLGAASDGSEVIGTSTMPESVLQFPRYVLSPLKGLINFFITSNGYGVELTLLLQDDRRWHLCVCVLLSIEHLER